MGVAEPKGRPLGPRGDRKAGAERAKSKSEGAHKEDGGGFEALLSNHLVRTALSLGFVLALMLGLAMLVKKVGARRAGSSLAAALGPGGSAPSGVMSIIGRYPVARGQSLVLLRVDRRVLLLSHTQGTARLRGGGAGGFSTLAEFTDPEEVASILMQAEEHHGRSINAKFRSLLHSYESRHEEEGVSHGRPDRRATRAAAGVERALPVSHREGDEQDLRLVQVHPSGDRAELWNDRATLRLHDEGRAGSASAAAVRSVMANAAMGPDPMGSLRERLAGLRGRGVQG
jgi:flagellar biogenesis protein FliO